MKKISAVFSTAALVTTTLLAGMPGTAHAVFDQVCAVSEIVTYTPPLTDTPQATTITIAGNLYNCSSTSNPTGTYATTDFSPGASCTGLFNSNSGSRVLDWNNPALTDSAFAFNRTAQRVNGNIEVTFLGSITAGVYTSSPTKQVIAAPAPNPTACSGSGVRTFSFTGTLEIGI